MATGVLHDLPGMTQQDYDALLEHLDLEENPAEGGLFHIAAPNPSGGWLILDVWESAEAFDAFARQRLVPAARALNLPLSRPRLFPVHNVFAPDVAWLSEFGRHSLPHR
jgi:hypothetical protein